MILSWLLYCLILDLALKIIATFFNLCCKLLHYHSFPQQLIRLIAEHDLGYICKINVLTLRYMIEVHCVTDICYWSHFFFWYDFRNESWVCIDVHWDDVVSIFLSDRLLVVNLVLVLLRNVFLKSLWDGCLKLGFGCSILFYLHHGLIK